MAKHHLAINTHFKNEGQEGKTCPVQGWVPVGWGGEMERVKQGK
jgi:hypothetical protein